MSFKAVKLFPDIYDIRPFINREHPILHPDSIDYSNYWEKEEIKCLEGFWGLDKADNKGGWRYMPPSLYFYINYCIIADEDERGKTTRMINPDLRDIDWLIHYGWLTALGFSGFENDEEYTCNRLVYKIENNIKLTPQEEVKLKNLNFLKRKDGEYKKYIESKEYLYKTFPKSLGRPIYDNDAKNFFLLTSRATGKSYSVSGILAQTFNFYGKKYYDESYLDNPAAAELLVGSSQTSKSNELIKKFLTIQEHLKTGPGAWGKGDEFIPGYFYNNCTGKTGPNNTDSPYRHEYRAQEGKIWLNKGTGTKLVHVAYADNAEAAVGTRPQIMVVEECGLSSDLLKIHAANETCMIRKNKFGSALYLGTGGNIDKINDSKIIFEDPETYDFVPYVDLWENRSRPIGCFIPAYYSNNVFKDHNGNTDIEAALEQEILERKRKEQASNSMALDGYMMARPLVPSEMFLSSTSNLFPTAKLRQREAEIETKNLFNIYASIGDLEWNDVDKKSVKWVEDLGPRRKSRPIQHMNLDQYKANLNSAIVIYEHPPDNIPNPTYRRSLYKVVYDPVKDDGGGTSLASILVYKGFAEESWNAGMQDTIVAEMLCRYDKVDDIHELAIKLATYYNSMILVENNLPGFINYCKMNGFVHKLQICPYEAIKKGGINYAHKYEYGVTMTRPLSVHCEQLIRQMLLEPWKKLDDGVLLLGLDKLYSLRIIRELQSYDRDGNYDHVSSLKLLVLWLSQERDVEIKEDDKKEDPYNDLNNFFKTRVRTVHPQKNNWYA